MLKKSRLFFQIIAKILGKSFLFLDDFLLLAGICVILWTNFRVNELFGWYSMGVVLIIFGLFAARLIGRSKKK
jgi:hypothetical protein